MKAIIRICALHLGHSLRFTSDDGGSYPRAPPVSFSPLKTWRMIWWVRRTQLQPPWWWQQPSARTDSKPQTSSRADLGGLWSNWRRRHSSGGTAPTDLGLRGAIRPSAAPDPLDQPVTRLSLGLDGTKIRSRLPRFYLGSRDGLSKSHCVRGSLFCWLRVRVTPAHT